MQCGPQFFLTVAHSTCRQASPIIGLTVNLITVRVGLGVDEQRVSIPTSVRLPQVQIPCVAQPQVMRIENVVDARPSQGDVEVCRRV